jgi:hypothetical protein
VTDQKANSATPNRNGAAFDAALEDHPLVKALYSILQALDDQYERERQNLITTLPEKSVKDRALAMLESQHLERREHDLRELTDLREPS